jgi:hypothetical protein
MQYDIIQKLHAKKHSASMTLEDYTSILSYGLEHICDKGLAVDAYSRNAIKLALEYNEEVVVQLLGVDLLVNSDFVLA